VKTYRAFLGLGSNVGDRARYLQQAADLVRAIDGVRVVWYSAVYETDPWGNPDQEKFLNAVGEIETTLEPGALLQALKSIESRLGRTPSSIPWSPREIDLDILLYDGLVYGDATVSVPHLHLHERRFVLVPFREIAPDVVHPVNGMTIEEMASACADKGKVVRSSHRIIP
jgi:2-amino-4-hydroxy-6-hydroxymethyldihydropteridine diphosphokinase